MPKWTYKAYLNTHPTQPNGVKAIATGDTVTFKGPDGFIVEVKAVGNLKPRDLFVGGETVFTSTNPSGDIQYDIDSLRGWRKAKARRKYIEYFELRNPRLNWPGGTPPKIPPG